MKQAHLKLFLSLILASLATAQYSLGDLSGRLAGGSSYGSYAAPAAPAAPAYSAPAAPAAPAYSAPAAPVPSSYSAPAAPVVSYAPKAIASSGYATTAYTKPASSYGTSGGSYGTSGGSYGTSGGSYGGSSGSYGYQPTGQPYGIQSTGDYSSYNYQQEPLDISKCGPPPTSNPCTAYGPQYYPLPGNPYCYIQCAFERLFVKPCPANLVWNPRITGCDWPTVASYGGDSYGSGASYGSGSSYGASSAAPAKDTSSYSYGRKRRTVERKKRQLVPVPPIPLGAPFLPFGIPGPVPFGGPLGFPGLPGPLGIPTPFYFPYRRPEYKYSYNDDYDYDYDDKDYGKGYGKKDKKYGKKQSSYYDDDDYSYKTKNYYDDDDDYSYKKDKYYDNDYDNGYSKKDKYGKKDKYDNDYNKKDKYNNDYYKKDKYDNDYNKKDKYDNDYNKKDKYNNDYYKKDKYNNKNNYYDDDDDDYDGYYKKDNDYYDDNKGYSKNSKYTFNGNFRPSYSDGYSKNRYDDYNYRDDDYYNDDYNYRKKRQYGYQSETEVKVLPALTSVPQVSLEVVSLCAGKINGENIPHPTDPSKYIACLSSDTQEIMDCPSGLIYDAALDRCEEIKKTELLCESQPCLNDGKCHQTGPTTFQCTCLNGWTGDRCETPLSSCASNPCGLGNSCHSLKTKDYPQDYVCLCNNRQGYGLNCERDTVPNPCLSTAGSFDQYHPFAFSSHAFIQCNGDLLYVQPCAAGLTWDQETKVCDIPVSATTSVPVPMPLVEKSIAYEVASGTEMKQPNVLPTISFDEKPAVFSNGYGSTEEKFLVKSKEEPKSSYGSYSGRTLKVKEAPAAYSTFFNPMPTLPSARIIKPKIIGPTEFLPTSHSRTFTPVFTQPNYGQAMPQKFRELHQKEKFFQRTEQYGEDLPAQPFPPTPAPVPRTFPSEAYATSINSYAQPQPERVFVPQLPKVLPKPLVQPETLRTSYGSTSGGY